MAKKASVEKQFKEHLNGVLDPANLSGAFARAYKVYQKIQTEKFKTQGASEGRSFPKTDPVSPYGKRKARVFRSYPGSGKKSLIATGYFAGAVIGPGSPFDGAEKHRAVFGKRRMTISIEQTGDNPDGQPFDYPEHLEDKYEAFSLSDDSMDEIAEAVFENIVKKGLFK